MSIVCDTCFIKYRHSINKFDFVGGPCTEDNCDGIVIHLDDDFMELIRDFNEKGYKTYYCCAGHTDSKSNVYVMFNLDGMFGEDIMHDIKKDYKLYDVFHRDLNVEETIELNNKLKKISNFGTFIDLCPNDFIFSYSYYEPMGLRVTISTPTGYFKRPNILNHIDDLSGARKVFYNMAEQLPQFELKGKNYE